MRTHQPGLAGDFRTLGRRIAITRFSFEFPIHCSVADLDWNHMDQEHRPYIHGTYNEAVRVASGKDFAISVTKLKFLGIPFSILVADIRLGPGRFCQTFNLFNLLTVHQDFGWDADGIFSETLIASSAIFKPLHGLIKKRLLTLFEVQNTEDIPVRLRRKELRARGYSFASDKPDFVTSNSNARGTRAPRLDRAHQVCLAGLKPNELTKVEAGPLELLIRLEDDQAVSVWPGACPHEGGPLEKGVVGRHEIQCPWHGLKYHCARLTTAQPIAVLGDHEICLDPALRLRISQSRPSPDLAEHPC